MPASSLFPFDSCLDAVIGFAIGITLPIDANPLTVSPQTPLCEVIALMQQVGNACKLSPFEGISPQDWLEDARGNCVLVVEESRLLGMVTTRDVVRFVAEGILEDRVAVSAAMNPRPMTVRRSQFPTLCTAINLWRRHRVRHLPLLSENEEVLGVLSWESLPGCLKSPEMLRWRRVEEVMSPKVIALAPDATVREVAEKMAEHPAGCLVIAEKMPDRQLRPLGLIVERDILEFQALKLDYHLRADQIMRPHLTPLRPHDNLFVAHQNMGQPGIHHLLVETEAGAIAGTLSQTDILEALDPMEMYSALENLQRQVRRMQGQRGKGDLAEDLDGAIINTVRSLVVVLDGKGRIIRFNKACEGLTGYSFAEVENRVFWEILLLPRQSQEVQGRFESLPASGFPPRQELLWLTKDLEVRLISHRNIIRFGGKGQVEYVILTGEEITLSGRRKKGEKSRENAEFLLIEKPEIMPDQNQANFAPELGKLGGIKPETEVKNSRLKSLMVSNPAIIYSWDYQSYRTTFVSENVRDILGYEPEEFLNDSNFWWDRIYPKDLEPILAELNQVLERGYCCYEYRFRHRDGDYRRMRDDVKLIRDEAGNPVELVGCWIEIRDTRFETVCDRKEIKASLQERETILSNICENTSLMMGVVELVDGDIYHLWDNPAAAKLLDLNVEQMKNQSCRSLGIPEDLIQLWLKQGRQTHESQKSARFEYAHRTPTGEHWLSATLCPIPGEHARPRCCYVVEEITERKRTEEALRHTTQNLLESQRIAHIGNWDFDVIAGQITWSEEIFRIFGFDPAGGEPTPEELAEMIHPEDREQYQQTLERSLTEGEYFDIEYRVIRPDGELRYLNTRGEVKQNEGGEAIRLFGVAIDITEQKLAEEALCASEARYRALVEQMPAAVYTVTVGEASMPLYISPHIEQMLGYTPDEWMSNPQLWSQRLHPEDREQMRDRLADIPTPDRPFSREYRLLTRDRDVVWIQDSAVVIRDEDRTPILLQGVMLDITERKQAEVALRQSEERFSTLIRNLSVGVMLHDSRGEVLLCNPKAWELLGLREVDLLGKTFLSPDWEIIHEDGSPFVSTHLPVSQAILTRQAVKNVLMGIYRPPAGEGDKELIWILVSAEPQLSEAGEVQHVISTFSDITILKRVQENLRTSEQLYRTIAHNFPNGTIFLFDRNLRYLVADGQGLANLQLRRDQLEGHRLSEVLSAEIYTSVEPLYQTALDGRERVEEIQDQDHTYLVRAVPIRNEEGEVILGMIVSQNITEQKQAELALQRANQHLAEVNRQLEQSVKALEQRHRESAIINQMIEFLQACHALEEAYGPISEFLKQLFPRCAGTVLLSNQKANSVESIAQFGDLAPGELNLGFDDCWALRRGQIHLADANRPGLFCPHVHQDPAPSASVCIPTIVQGQAFGLFYLRTQDPTGLGPGQQQLAQTVAEQISLGLSNLQLREELRSQSVRDPLTGLFNRRYLKEFLQREVERSQRSGLPLGVIMVDIDHFKQFNDNFGHEAGDLVLQEVARFLQRHVRLSDIACRYGGEEMTLILPEMPPEAVKARAEQLCDGILELRLTYQGKDLGRITASFGVACFPHNGSTPEELIQKADGALYQAKNRGRNRVVCA